MLKLVLPTFLLAACTVPKAKTLRMGDVVQFKFAGRNLFYSDACQDVGTVHEFNTFSDSTRYMIETKCKIKNYVNAEFIWVDEEDILKVLKLGSDTSDTLDKSSSKEITP